MASAIWIPSRTITITVSAYNEGTARMFRVSGPSGETARVPMSVRPADVDRVAAWVEKTVSDELEEALLQVNDECLEMYGAHLSSLHRD